MYKRKTYKKNEISKENNKIPQKNTYLLVQQSPESPGRSLQEEPTKKNEISKENNKTPQKNTYLLVQQNPESPGRNLQKYKRETYKKKWN